MGQRSKGLAIGLIWGVSRWFIPVALNCNVRESSMAQVEGLMAWIFMQAGLFRNVTRPLLSAVSTR